MRQNVLNCVTLFQNNSMRALEAYFGNVTGTPVTIPAAAEPVSVPSPVPAPVPAEIPAPAPAPASAPAEISVPAVEEPVPAAPVSEPAPAPVSVPAAVQPSADMYAVLTEAIADKTGYPTDMIDEEMELEADLGIDSIKRVEILSDDDCVFRTGDTQICPLIASEASHIAIFLIAYMGLDAISKGTLSYRAIDSSMTAYSERPFRVGDTLRTVLKINRFVKNGSTTLLFFTFESYNGDELISITEATGGFFTRADLSSTKGVIQPKIQMRKDMEPKEFLHFSNTDRTSYEKHELEAFYRGDYEGCFGVKPKPTQKELYYLPYDLKMVDRVTKIDYNGGVYGRGIICGEKQITPDMWPFKAHFKNDPVFPAIITSDGVTQLGMFLLAHAGLLNKFDNANFTTIKGNCCNSRFRGQVRHGYSTLRYEISVKEVVETEEDICAYLDAAIFNDDVQIMQIDSYALKITDAGN